MVDLNDPMMPIAWTKTYAGRAGSTGRVFCSTIGAANDLLSEGTRRLLVNAAIGRWGWRGRFLKLRCGLVGDYQPSNFMFGGFKPGVRRRSMS